LETINQRDFPVSCATTHSLFQAAGNSTSFAEKETRHLALTAPGFPLDSFRRRLVR
jgi:hypothetical protein